MMNNQYPYFGFTGAPQMSSMSPTMQSMPGFNSMSNPALLTSPQQQMSLYGGGDQTGAQQSSMAQNPMQTMAMMQALSQMGQPSRTPQSALGSISQAMPMLGMLAQNPQAQQGMSGLGGLLGGLFSSGAAAGA